MADEVYYFDGSEGCDACDGFTGYYLDIPEGAHEGCNCPIQTVEADLEYEIRAVEWQEGNVQVEREDAFDNCDSDEEGFCGIWLDEEMEESFDEGLREAVEAAGWSEPTADSLDVTFTIAPHARGTLKVVIHRYVAEFSGEVWVIFPDGTEQQVGDAQGYFGMNIHIEDVEFEGSSCDPDLSPWIPRSGDDDGSGDSDDADDLIV